MLKNEMESYVRMGEGGLKNLSYMGARGGAKNCQNHPDVINDWPLTSSTRALITMVTILTQSKDYYIYLSHMLRKASHVIPTKSSL